MTFLILFFSFIGSSLLTLSWVAKDLKCGNARSLFVCGMCFALVAVSIAIVK